MRDLDIRKALHIHLRQLHWGEEVLVVDELRMCCGEARIDVALFNASLSGYEIKSEHDTLARLPDQLRIYSDVCDFVTLVVSQRHVARVREMLPDWCGVLVAEPDGAGVVLAESTKANQNPTVDPLKRAQLLWRSEAIAILAMRGLLKGCRSKPRYALWKALADRIPAADLNSDIVAAIKSRGDWRVDRQRGQCDAIPSP